MRALQKLTATEAARLISTREITSEALVQACLDRIQERDSDVQAWVHIDAASALARAREIDRAGARGVLAGIPIAVKDVIDTADMPTQYNSAIYRDHRPSADAACVALARREGAIVLGKTVTTEFASRTPGPTCNPHNIAHTPGGSSSGSAAAVADFMVPLAFGTQTGGSVIRPAAYCGVVGYKPTFGTINCSGLKHLAESLDTIGVIGRSVADCALLVHATSARELPDFGAPLVAPRIGLCRTSRSKKASSDSHAALEAAAGTLARRGARVAEFSLPTHFDLLYDEQTVISGFEAARALAYELDTQPQGLSEHMRARLAKYAKAPRKAYAEAMRHALKCRREFEDLMGDFDVILTASAPGAAPAGIASTGSSLFNRNWTLLHLPCVTIPAAQASAGLPLGLQCVGRYDDDPRVLLAAEWARRALV